VPKFDVRLALGVTLLASVALVSGCAKPSASANVYTYGQAQSDQVVRNGTIVNVRPITIQNDRTSGAGMVAGGAVQKYGPNLEDHQQLLTAAADILIEIYMAESTVLRTEKLAKKEGEENVKEQIAMAKLYLYKAVDVVTQKGKESIISFAEGDEQRMMLMGLRRFTKYTNMPNIVGLRETITTKLVVENSYCFCYKFLNFSNI
jgi:hypothetical protein